MMSKRALVVLLVSFFLSSFSFAANKSKFQKAEAVHFDRDGEKWAERTLKKMTLEEKVGQMFMIWARVTFKNVENPDFKLLQANIAKYHIGGIAVSVPVEGPFLIKNEPLETAALTNELQQESKLPLIMAADFEFGLSMRLFGATAFPQPMAFGAAGRPEFAEALGRVTAEEARAVGVHWNFFPVADVNSNPANPIINTRAFGEDPAQVGNLVAAYIRGAHQAGMLATAKHFPGHGDTATDSHLGVAAVSGDMQRLRSVELPPFKQAIAAGADAVLIAHVTVPALEPDPNTVATTSKTIVTGLLKNELGFKGLVVTDALDMNGLMRLYSSTGNPSAAAAVAAAKAGNDVLLIPADLDGAYNGVLNAVKSGEIPVAQIDASVLKILRAKAAVGLDKARLVDLNAVDQIVARPANVALGQQVADAAVTLVRDNGQALPLQKAAISGTGHYVNAYTKVEGIANHDVAVVFTDDVRFETGRTFEHNLHMRVPDANVIYVDPRVAAVMSAQVLAAVQQANRVLVPVYASPLAGKVVQRTAAGEIRNSVALPDDSAALLHRILQIAASKTVIIAMGNPYVGSDFPEVLNYMCTFSSTSVSEVSAVKALFGEIPLAGKTPVTIPQIAERGAGLPHMQAAQGDQNGNIPRPNVGMQ